MHPCFRGLYIDGTVAEMDLARILNAGLLNIQLIMHMTEYLYSPPPAQTAFFLIQCHIISCLFRDLQFICTLLKCIQTWKVSNQAYLCMDILSPEIVFFLL